MTDRSKFEQMLEHLVNEDTDKAKELFHQLVVEKSREIYETILAEDFTTEEADEEEEDLDEAKDEDEDDKEMEESFGFAEGDDEEDTGDIGGDAGDDFVDDIDADMGDEGDEEGMEGEGDIEDRVVDLEDALDDLRAEFEALMGDEGGDDMGGMDDMGGDDDMGGMDDMDKMPEDSFMREYVEKVGNPKHGDNGANTKSTVAGKNDMGGTTANMVKGGESTTGGTKGGLANPTSKEDNAGNVNVPGGKAGVKHLKKMSNPAGGDGGVNTKSTLGAK